jgi:hypothetical protein
MRSTIVEDFKSTGVLRSVEAVASSLGISVANLNTKLREEAPLTNLLGLTPKQALALIDHWKGIEIFTSMIVDTLRAQAAVEAKLRAQRKLLDG